MTHAYTEPLKTSPTAPLRVAAGSPAHLHPPVRGNGRVSSLITLQTCGWTLPLWQERSCSARDLMDGSKYLEEEWSWQLCETQQRHLCTHARPLGPIDWVDRWSEDNPYYVEEMANVDVERFSRWFAQEFFPNPDHWRARIGWPAPHDVFLTPEVTVNWTQISDAPGCPGPGYLATLTNPWAMQATDPTGLRHVTALLRRREGGWVENEPMVRMYWVSKLWEWTFCDSYGGNEKGKSE